MNGLLFLFLQFASFMFPCRFAINNLNRITRSGAEFDEIIQERWNPRLMADFIYQSFLHQFEGGQFFNYDKRVFGYQLRSGKGKMGANGVLSLNGGKTTCMPIVVKGDNFKDVKGRNGANADKSGDIIHMSVLRSFVPAFVTNDNTLRGNEAKLDFGQFDVGIDAYRAATAFTLTASELTNQDDQEIAYSANAEAAARHMDALCFKEMLHGGGTSTSGTSFTTPTAYAGGQSSSLTVVSSRSAITVDDLKKLYFKLKGQGAIPIQIDKVKGLRSVGKEVPRYIAIMSVTDEYNLTLDSDYEDYQINANVRGQMNPVFSGAVADINGLCTYVLEDPAQGSIRIGTPLRPVTTFSAATGTGTGTVTVGATSDDNYDYTMNFPDSGYLVVIDSTGTVTEVLTYTAKTSYQFTISARAVQGTATNHASGTEVALITDRVLGMGGQAMLKSYGKAPYFITQKDDYDEEIGIGVRYVAGFQGMLDSNDAPKNFAVLETFGFEDFR